MHAVPAAPSVAKYAGLTGMIYSVLSRRMVDRSWLWLPVHRGSRRVVFRRRGVVLWCGRVVFRCRVVHRRWLVLRNGVVLRHWLLVEMVEEVLLDRGAEERGRALRGRVVRLAGDGDEGAARHGRDPGGLLAGAGLVRGAVELRVAVGAVEVGGEGDAEGSGALELADGLGLVLAVGVLALDRHLKTCGQRDTVY